MRKLRIAVLDLITKGFNRSIYARIMHANLVSIMPQVVALWCEEAGHEVDFVCYTGCEKLNEELSEKYDIAFIGAFTQAAQLAYALSNFLRSKGAVTVLGGPHARCYPQDAQKYFDYVLGFTNKSIIQDVLHDWAPHRPTGLHLSVQQQPSTLPGIAERWKFVELTLQKAPLIKIVPMISSIGCPYTCSFCIDSEIPYQSLDAEILKEDLRFLLKKFKRPHVAWHDPNFGVRFDDQLDAIEAAVPPNSIDFIAESSLSLLSEDRLKRLQKNGFKALLPGIESWYDLGNKSKSGKNKGLDKVRHVSDHVNMIMDYIPYVQANFVLGLDGDEGPEPFELTKRFVDLSPGVFNGYSLLSAFGQAAPLNLQYQRENRVLPFPFHFLNNNHAMNVKPKNYSWPEFYDHVIDLSKYTFSWRAISRRFFAVRESIPRWMNVIRAVSSEGFGRIKRYSLIRRKMDEDKQVRAFFERETTELPEFYYEWIKRDLGPLWEWLPPGALYHDPNAYLKSESAKKDDKQSSQNEKLSDQEVGAPAAI
ncbi:MAG: B12-binding domain-containing radical SAM protein [bacterium]